MPFFRGKIHINKQNEKPNREKVLENNPLNYSWLSELWSRQESNLYLKFRKLLFYPLNYGTCSLGRKNNTFRPVYGLFAPLNNG